MARSRTSGEYFLGRAMGSILSRNEPSDETGAVQPITKNAQFPDRGRTAWQLNVYAGERRDLVG
jgi:hypothetical protein